MVVDEVLPLALLASFPWMSSKLPGSRQWEKQNRSLFPLLGFWLLWKFPGISKIVWKNITVGVCAGKHHPPCHVNFSLILRAWSRIFLSMVFTLSLHTDVVHSICKNHLLKQTFLLVHVCGWCKPCNYVPVTHTLSRRSLRSGLLESQDSSVVRSTWCNWAF